MVKVNQHIVEVVIIWPDDKWEPAAENEYLQSCLTGIAEHFQSHPIKNEEQRREITNRLGRIYAKVHISPCMSGVIQW